jgi:hypothetical protein
MHWRWRPLALALVRALVPYAASGQQSVSGAALEIVFKAPVNSSALQSNAGFVVDIALFGASGAMPPLAELEICIAGLGKAVTCYSAEHTDLSSDGGDGDGEAASPTQTRRLKVAYYSPPGRVALHASLRRRGHGTLSNATAHFTVLLADDVDSAALPAPPVLEVLDGAPCPVLGAALSAARGLVVARDGQPVSLSASLYGSGYSGYSGPSGSGSRRKQSAYDLTTTVMQACRLLQQCVAACPTNPRCLVSLATLVVQYPSLEMAAAADGLLRRLLPHQW